MAHFAIPYRQAEVTNLSMQEKQKSANCVIKSGALYQKYLGMPLFLQLAGHNIQNIHNGLINSARQLLATT